jgi:hypothetical protein
MSEENSKTENILRAAEGLGSSGLSLLVGLGLWGLIAVFGALALIFLLLNDGYIYSKENCIKLQQIEERVYKINSCTDTVTEINGQE